MNPLPSGSIRERVDVLNRVVYILDKLKGQVWTDHESGCIVEALNLLTIEIPTIEEELREWVVVFNQSQ